MLDNTLPGEVLLEKSAVTQKIASEVSKRIVGQKKMIERIIIGLLSDGHILLEGVPGLAKTLTVSSVAEAVNTGFQRIQFTPDLLPADLVGTMIFDQKTGDFIPKKGPVFSNIILADEINRAPAKVQSALLECMQEKQVTIGDETYKLDSPFLVLATQNPIEQEGTYPLPEAQLDRFMLKVSVDYPEREEERTMLDKMTGESKINLSPVASASEILECRDTVRKIFVDGKIKDYIIDIVSATRTPEKYKLKDLVELIDFGASPRASIYLCEAARARAFMKGRGFVTPEDVKMIGFDVLRHRVMPSFEARAEDIGSEQIISRIFDAVEVP
ncbi:MAG: AAA family ATPase [Fibrobacterota bacterium]